MKPCGRHKRLGCMEYQCFSDRQRSRLVGDSDDTGVVEAGFGSTFSYTDTSSSSTESSSSSSDGASGSSE